MDIELNDLIQRWIQFDKVHTFKRRFQFIDVI